MDVPPAKLMDFPIAHFLPGFALALLTPNFFGEQPEVRNPEIRKKKTPVMLAHVQLLVHVLRPSPAEPSAAICSFQWMFWAIKRWDIDCGDGYKHV
jgi:hypothetical protein